MPHSYVSNLMHCTFGTRERFPFIEPELESRLWPYIGGIARENRMKALAVGGIEDHIHALLSLPATMSFAKAVQLIKGGSSKWVHQTFPKLQQFAWQDGYGAFSLAGRNLEKPLTIFKSRKSIIESEPFRRNSWNYLIGTASNTIADMFTK